MARTENFGRATHISSSAPSVELHQCLASHVAAISPFVEKLMRFIGLFMRRFGTAKNTEGSPDGRGFVRRERYRGANAKTGDNLGWMEGYVFDVGVT